MYVEVKVIIDENKIKEVGKYPADYIFHHIACLAKVRRMYLIHESMDEHTGEHMVVYRTDYKTNPNAPIAAGFFVNYVYLSPANPYLIKMTLFDSKDNSLEDCIPAIKEMEDKYGGVYDTKPVHKKTKVQEKKSDEQKQEDTNYAEVKVVVDENKIKEVGKYPVSYIFHHIACLAKTRKMYLSQESVDEQTGKHMVAYRTDFNTNPNAPITAGFFANHVYDSPAKPYLVEMTLFDTSDSSLEDCIAGIKEMEEKYG